MRKGKIKPTDKIQVFSGSRQPENALNYDRIIKDLNRLKSIVVKWTIATGMACNVGNYNLLINYLKAHRQYTEEDQFDGSFELLPDLNEVFLERVTNENTIFKSFNLFKNSIWPIRFGAKFISKMKDMNYEQCVYVLSYVAKASEGQLKEPRTTSLQTKFFPFNRFFLMKIYKDRSLLISVGVQKKPIGSKNNVIKRYEYTSYMMFWDIVNEFNIQKYKFNQTLAVYVESLSNDVARRDHSQELTIDSNRSIKTNRYLFQILINPYTQQPIINPVNIATDIVHPLHFKIYYPSTLETSTLYFDYQIKRWVDKDFHKNLELKVFNEFQRKVNIEMIKKYADFQSAKVLVELLTKIPNFKIKLTEQQKDVIGENGNVMVIGRSGTGKTTCAVLRLFSIEMLFKIRLSLQKKKNEKLLKNTNCTANDIDQTLGLHCIFLTASPVLTHEIQRYYKKITDNIKQQLEKKRIRDAQKKKQEEKQISKQQQSQQKMEERHDSDMQPQILVEQRNNKKVQEQQHIKSQISGIQMDQQEQLQIKDEFEELEDFQQKTQNIKPLQDFQEKDFPGFFPVKAFILMIDGTINRPFFIRNKNKTLNQIDSRAAWHNQKKGVMMIEKNFRNQNEDDDQKIEGFEQIDEEINYSDEEQLEHQYLRQIQLKQNINKQNLTKKMKAKQNQNLSFEVDFDYFRNYFWPTIYNYSQQNVSVNLVWTEIFSTIKGSANSHIYGGQYLTQTAYMAYSTNMFLNKEAKKYVYDIFCRYERWKTKVGGYDLMDCVNYILNNIRFRGYHGPEIHYLMIDQIQDLPHAIIYLLSKITSHGVFYSGDTAQTIAKGVGFRFCDLKNLFNKKQFDDSLLLQPPVVKQLTINFRSHNNILQMANSVVSSIQILFPKTIDKLKKQRSDLNGPKPMILCSEDLELLFYVLCGNTEGKGKSQSPLEFGCEQVIIVRDQQSKKRIPRILEHALCLTIYEAKGLQFNDVILFNFFTETTCPDKWGILKHLRASEVQLTKQQYYQSLTKHMEEEEDQQKEQKEDICTVNAKQQTFIVKKIIGESKKLAMVQLNNYAQICSELKMLYTAITRPRNTLIIYDQDPSPRKIMEKLWDSLGVIQLIDRTVMLQPENLNNTIFKHVMSSTNKQQWKKQGLKMYARRYFEQAKKCFQNSGDEYLYKKALANQIADNSTKKLIEIQSQRNGLKEGFFIYKDMSKSEQGKLKKKLLRQENQCYKGFSEAALVFQNLQMLKQAGQCYFSGKQYENAHRVFLKAKMFKQAGESLQMSKNYKEAAELYERVDDYLKVIECLDMVNEWQLILKAIAKFEALMSEFERQALIKKYASLLLESLSYHIQFQNQENELPESNRVQVIEEEEQSEQESDSESEQEQKQQQDKQQQQQQLQIKNQIKVEQKLQIMMEEKLTEQKIEVGEIQIQKTENKVEKIIEVKVQDKQGNSKQDNKDKQGQNEVFEVLQKNVVNESDSSFSDLNVKSESSFSELNEYGQLQLDMESIKSMVEPDDLWLRSAMSEIQHKTQSEFSVLNEQQNYLSKARIIKTKGNIFVHEEVMNKILTVTSLVTSNTAFLKQFKGYQSLLSLNKSENTTIPQQSKEIQEFQELTPQTINVALDTLESFKLYKLCLFVCNRYHIINRVGRYLLSIAIKYSTNCQNSTRLNSALISPSVFRKKQLQKGVLASIALHAIFQNVNPDFLKIKINNDKSNQNSLGNYFIQGLILQGLLKKSVFMVDQKQSLQLLYNYSDFSTYKQIYNKNILEYQQPFPPTLPSNPQQLKLFVLTLENFIQNYSIINFLENIPQRLNKQIKVGNLDQINYNSVPQYIPFFKALIQGEQPILYLLKSKKNDLVKIMQSEHLHEMIDLTVTIGLILNNNKLSDYLSENLELQEFIEFYQCIKVIQTSIAKMNNSTALRHIEALLSIYQCRKVDYCQSLRFIGDGYGFVDRKSIIVNDILQQQKKKQKTFAFFFEQQFNCLIVRIENIIDIISKRLNRAVLKLLLNRKSIKVQKQQILFKEDLVKANNRFLFNIIIDHHIELLKLQIFGKIQSKIVKSKQNKLRKYPLKANTKHYYLEELQSSSDQEQIHQHIQSQLFCLGTCPSIFNYHLACYALRDYSNRKSQKILSGNILWAVSMNTQYREYVQRLGGYHLFDAIQYKKFHRLDLYADNVLSVANLLPYKDKVYLFSQLIVLLLIQHQISVEGRNTKIKLSKSGLKFLQNLNPVTIKQRSNNAEINQVEPISKQRVRLALGNDVSDYVCVFQYTSAYVCELDSDKIWQLIWQYLNLLVSLDVQQLTNDMLIMCLINLNFNNKIHKGLSSLMKEYLSNQVYLQKLAKCNEYQQFCSIKNQMVKTNAFGDLINNEIRITDVGDLDCSITECDFDFDKQGMTIKSRTNAVNIISKWWKKISRRPKLKITSSELAEARIIRVTYRAKYINPQDKFLNASSKIRQQLLSFYLQRPVTSSLDFHFILQTLNQIQDLRSDYINLIKDYNHALFEVDIPQFQQKIKELRDNVSIWKADEKWLRNNDITLKKRKVFEVKWMTKMTPSAHAKLLRRRAGLKKQQKLQQKKLFIKS